ncbi:MAG: histidinol-phosphatase [Armatimonadetes bacterium]|nr:histidinol-phosphatase [Armatimonadota bacterium]MDE2205153.1 histidinol-phosphatase [Armatimonadota bacterium]
MIGNYTAVDYQVHSRFSHDGRATIDQHCRRAIEIGLDEIGFSEHKDFDPQDPVVDYFQYQLWMKAIQKARERYEGRLTIRAGIEIDYQRWFEDEIGIWLQQHAFDFVIGSVHYVDRKMLMTPEYNAGRTAYTAWRDYLAAVRDSVAAGLFDIIGHMEYANRRGVAVWGLPEAGSLEDETNDVLRLAVKKRCALEINSAGLHQGIGVTYPCADTVRRYADLGGTLLSIGSDAHHPDQLGWKYQTVAELAIDCGLTTVTTWSNRKRLIRPLRPSGARDSRKAPPAPE